MFWKKSKHITILNEKETKPILVTSTVIITEKPTLTHIPYPFIQNHPHSYLFPKLLEAKETIQRIYLEGLIESQPTPHDEERAANEVIAVALKVASLLGTLEEHLRKPLPERRHLCGEDMFGRYEARLAEVPKAVKSLIHRVKVLERALWTGAALAVLEGRKKRREIDRREREFRQWTVEKLLRDGFLMRGITDRYGRPRTEFRDVCRRWGGFKGEI